MEEVGTALAISPSGRRVPIAFLQVGDKVRAYRIKDGQYANWEIAVGINFNSKAEAVEHLERKGWSVEIDE